MNAPAAWFDRAIREGLARMLLIGLDYRPAEDVAAEVFDQWVDDLWVGRDWIEKADAPRIAEAFRRLRIGRTAWPKPADFLGVVIHIPRAKPKGLALPAPARRGNSPKVDAIFDDLARFLHPERKPEGAPDGKDQIPE